MIRYYLNKSMPQLAAAQCADQALARLKGRGPWAAFECDGGMCLQRGQAASWGPIQDGVGGLRFQVADPLPAFADAVKVHDRGPVGWVDLPGSIRLPIKLAAYAPIAIGLDDAPAGPCDEYGLTASRLWDRLKSEELPVVDPQLVRFARLALMSQTDLTHELIHAYGLLTTDTVVAIFDAATGYSGKAVAPAGGG